MIAFIGRRLLHTIVVLVIVSFIAFSVLHLLPGDPALTMLGIEATTEQIEALREELGLNKPLVIQYVHWFGNVLQGDLGRSIFYRESVAQIIAARLPATFFLGMLALIFSVLLSIPAGVISAVRRGGFLDSLTSLIANVGVAVPVFWLGILGIYFFALHLGWLPVYGYTSPFDDFWLSIKKAVMPVVCLSVLPLAVWTRQTRSSMLEVIREDYIRTARSKGLKEGTVITRHALKNAIIPVITLLGLQVRNLVGGSVLVETVFNIPGMGRLLVTSVLGKDFPVVQGCILVIALVVALANLVVDISYGYFNPRTRNE
jgi:peptide/nickel transport system permease protein